MIGQNNQAGKSILKTDYSDANSSVESNLRTAVKILLKTMDASSPSAERFELTVLTREDGVVVHRVLAEAQVQRLLEDIQAEVEKEKKKAEATSGDV